MNGAGKDKGSNKTNSTHQIYSHDASKYQPKRIGGHSNTDPCCLHAMGIQAKWNDDVVKMATHRQQKTTQVEHAEKVDCLFYFFDPFCSVPVVGD